jgi:pimeloyl-ACP methyl ester carboxylesterase
MPIERDLSFLDHPIILQRLFLPRKAYSREEDTEKRFIMRFPVDEQVEVCGTFHKASQTAPTVLFFHGNGEIAQDFDEIGPLYSDERNINFCVVDYRGYGLSTGEPSFSSMFQDSHTIFNQFRKYLIKNGYSGSLFVMGRSLGSASAVEITYNYQNQLSGLILESGIAYAYELLQRLGIPQVLLPSDKEKEIDALLMMREIKIPTLIIHGELDMLVPISNGQALYEYSGSNTKTLLPIAKGGHNNLFLVGFQEYMEAFESFVSK